MRRKFFSVSCVYPECGQPLVKPIQESLLGGIDTGVDATVNNITPVRAITNDMYVKDIFKKIKSVKWDKQRKGQFIGGRPIYGYKMYPVEK